MGVSKVRRICHEGAQSGIVAGVDQLFDDLALDRARVNGGVGGAKDGDSQESESDDNTLAESPFALQRDSGELDSETATKPQRGG